MALSQGAPRRRRVDRRLPALSSLRGHRPAQERRCAAVANRPMSVPISDRMTWALSSLTPGIVLNCLTASRKQASPASASRSISAMAASSASTQFDLDERRRLPAALAERRVGCAHVEARELRHLCRQEVEHLVLPRAAINDVAGIDASTALQPQRLGHATVAAGGLPNGQPAQVDVFGERGNDPMRCRVEIALDTSVAGLMLTHAPNREHHLHDALQTASFG